MHSELAVTVTTKVVSSWSLKGRKASLKFSHLPCSCYIIHTSSNFVIIKHLFSRGDVARSANPTKVSSQQNQQPCQPPPKCPQIVPPLSIPQSAHSSVQLPIHLQSLPAVAPGMGAAVALGVGTSAWATQSPSLPPAWAPEHLLLWMWVLGGLQVLWWPWGLLLTLTRPQETLKKGTIRMKGQRTYCSLKFYPLLSYLSFLDPHQLNKRKICLSKAIRVMALILYSIGLMLVSVFLRLLEKF